MAESFRRTKPNGIALVGATSALPRPITSFVGRTEEIAVIAEMLTDPHLQLLNLTGSGGIGKTRLALEVARRSIPQFPDGVVFAAMADLRDPELVLVTVARAVGIHQGGETNLVDRFRDYLGSSRVLVVVDNLEHLLNGVSPLAAILAVCPGLTMLTTSRSRLGISGERVFDVAPLSIEHAVELFEHRARAITADFTSGPGTHQAVSEICEHVDCLPLAIELAAARVAVLPPTAMLARLSNRLSFLSLGRRDAPERHQSMREAIDWSYALLTTPERDLFQRLAVFEGGFTLDGALAICDPDSDVLALVSGLESSCFIKPIKTASGKHRFIILQILREYGLEQLRAKGDEGAIRQLHADHIIDLCADTERIWWQPGGLDKLIELDAEVPNIRLALTRLRNTGNVRGLLQLAGTLAPLWASRGYSVEGRRWLEWGLPRSDESCDPYVTVALRALSWILVQVDESYRALVLAQHVVSLAEGIGDDRNRVTGLMLSGIGANRFGRPDLSVDFFDQAGEALAGCTNEPWAPITGCILLNLRATTHFERGELDEAEQCSSQMLQLQQSQGLRFTPAGHAWKGLGYVARARGQPDRALSLHMVSLQNAREAQDVRQSATGLGAAAGAIAALGQYQAAAQLFGASEIMHERINHPFVSETFVIQRALGLPEPWSSMFPECRVADGLRQTLLARTAALRAVRLDPAQAQSWWDEGRKIDLDAAIALIEEIESGLAATEALPGGLSPREHEILQLVAEGLTDREIAGRLFISHRTAQNHIQHIYQKISVSSRVEATVWAIHHGLA